MKEWHEKYRTGCEDQIGCRPIGNRDQNQG